MTNYELFTCQGYKYMSYLAEQIQKLKSEIDTYFTSDRDIKLRLLIEEDLPKLKEEIEGHLNDIIDSFNKMDVEKMNNINFEKKDEHKETIDSIEKIGDKLNKLINYFEYVVNRMTQLENEKVMGKDEYEKPF